MQQQAQSKKNSFEDDLMDYDNDLQIDLEP